MQAQDLCTKLEDYVKDAIRRVGIPFVLCISNLGTALENTKKGVQMPSGDIIGSFMSADDIVILANNEEDLENLKEVLEDWCSRYKMKISLKKTQIFL